MRVAEGDAHDVHNCAVVITAIPKRMSWPLRREPAASFPLPARMRGRGEGAACYRYRSGPGGPGGPRRVRRSKPPAAGADGDKPVCGGIAVPVSD